ncbi:16S rRNA (uracil(1498)-N(3))-methyltransferase [Fredinandcohnia quinoae]|uniref:Ribosomal RNA small subunit methyltransferase E n=1 Tax=Fredinandcohnia quinoae TaxID=2918902 RepID=A0AAW5DY28_9BACI|nr:16S rRNA (uracil(1498)-N(3))-methyltransferase [Fredinandcohnia sp. SECRCQ15]MCH1624988.1 16S rRNA (uracil(1498)-N(3))-methyltransferase [Fredinandcohnia sp. SECRCQ15]
MQRYFVDKFEESSTIITGDDVHHIIRVMRMDVGHQIICCDPNGKVARCTITEISNDVVFVNVVEWIEKSNELPIKVTIASGLPKGDKLEYVIQKGTELGASEFVPFIAARSVVKWDEKKGLKKVERWNKIAKEAAEQSHRTIIPSVHEALSLTDLLTYSQSYDYKLIAYEEDAKSGEKSKLVRLFNELVEGQSLLVVVGPEGGLSEKEVSRLEENGFLTCSFGPRILRTETAPLYVLSAVSYYFELAR